MQTPFERLAAVLDNASANYLSESQRQQQLADQRQYAAQQLADQRTYDDELTNKNRAYEQEAALFKAGYLSKPVGKNTPEEIAAAAALAAQHALAIRDEEAATRKDTAAKRDHDAKQREREEQGWALNPLKSDNRKAMEAAVDGGMIDFGKPAAQMTDEEIEQAYTKTRGDSIARANAGDDYANRLQAEFLKADKDSDPTPTVAEINRARAANPPKSSSRADLQMAEEAAQQLAGQIAAQRAAFAMKDRETIRYLMSDVLKKGHYPAAALGAPAAPAPAAPAPAPATPAPATPIALGLDEEVKRRGIAEALDKDWPQIQADYQLASLGDDAIREQINRPTYTRGRLSRSSYEPLVSRPATQAEIEARLSGIRTSQDEAKKRLVKRRSQFEAYAPADEARARQVAAILGLTGLGETIRKNAFESTAAALAQ